MTCWDNNSGSNYFIDVQAGGSTDGIGSAMIQPNVLAVEWGPDISGNLFLDVLVKNLAYAKQVGIVYTTDNWATFQNAFGAYQQSYPPASTPQQINAELWRVVAPTGAGNTGQFAVFYTVGGDTFWDNNFSQNYSF
jgi:hypothetical protein